MRTAGLIVAVTLALGALASAATVRATSRVIDLRDFVGIDLANGIKAAIVPGEAFSVTADSPNGGDLQDLKLTVSDGVLKAWFDWNIFQLFNFAGRNVTLQIAMPELDSIALSGGANLAVNTVPSDDLIIHASGGARLAMNEASAKRYVIDLSGGSTARLSGTCYSAAVTVSGGAALAAHDLICADVTGTASGGARIEITATASVTADASGGAVMTVSGGPTVTSVNSSGGGRVDFP